MADSPKDAENGSEIKTVLRRLGPVGPLAVIAATLPAIGGFAVLGTLAVVGPWLREQGPGGILIYIAGFAITSGLAILPTYAQAALGGWTFGFARGLPAALGGFLGGSIIGYVIARRASGQRVTKIIAEHAKWKAVYEALIGGGFFKTLLIVTLIRLPPNSPFAITNLVLAATRVPFSVYVLGTLLGMAPRTAVAALIASQLEQLDFARQKWLLIGGIVVGVIVLAVIGHIGNRAIAGLTGMQKADPGARD
jgi:uncharacterized membrane protein YdjX (TVP38/TMEM64 family)